jgi:NADH-quinone oxidoreductase subunit N
VNATEAAPSSMQYLELLYATLPEVLIAALGLGLLLLDVSLLRDREPAQRTRWLAGLAAAGLGGVLVLLVLWASAAGSGTLYADAERIIVVDRLGLVMKALVVALAIGTVLISVGYEISRHVGEYFCITAFATTAMCFVIGTENLLLFFVALELLSVCLYVLTALHKGVLRSAEGALKYFMFGALSSAFLFFGLSYVIGVGGTAQLRELGPAIARLSADGTPPLLLIVGMLFVVVGVGFKIAVAPFHSWAPDAYEGAPTPVAALIATASKVAAFVIGIKIFVMAFGTLPGEATWSMLGMERTDISFVAGWTPVLAILAVLSMVWGNLAAMAQRNVKRLLAYSSIAHAGYILVGLIAADALGVTSVLFYLFGYTLTTLGAFGVVAALTRVAGGDDLEDFDGMAQRAPLLSLFMLVFVLSLAGIPPLAGFFGKFFLFSAAMKADAAGLGLLWLVGVALAASAVSLYYYLTLLKHFFIHAPRSERPFAVSLSLQLTLGVIAAAVIALGVWPEPLVALLGEDLAASGWFPAGR